MEQRRRGRREARQGGLAEVKVCGIVSESDSYSDRDSDRDSDNVSVGVRVRSGNCAGVGDVWFLT